MGALLDPIVDRLTILAGAVVCWHFELLPRWALAALAVREVATLVLAKYGLQHGVDLEITWVGRIAVFLIMGGIFWSQVLDWLIIEIGFCVGVAISIAATILYARVARRRRGRSARRRRRRRCTPAFNLQPLIDPLPHAPIIGFDRSAFAGETRKETR